MAGDVKAPEVCPTCEGYGWVIYAVNSEVSRSDYCPNCRCVICGARTDVIGGECGACSDEADRYESRKADR